MASGATSTSVVTIRSSELSARRSDRTCPMIWPRSTDSSTGTRGRAKIERLSMIFDARTACSPTVRRVVSSLPGGRGLPPFMASSRSWTRARMTARGFRSSWAIPAAREARDQGLAHVRHQVGPPVLDARDADDARAEPLSQTVHHRTQALGVEPVHTAGDDGHAVDLAGPVHELVGARPRQPGLHLL